MWVFIVTFEEVVGSLNQEFHGLEDFTMGDFSTEVTPEHFDRIQPGAVGGQVKQNQSSGRGTHDCLYFIIFMGVGIIPRHKNGSGRMFVHQGLQQFSHFRFKLLFQLTGMAVT